MLGGNIYRALAVDLGRARDRRCPGPTGRAGRELATLGDDYFQVVHTIDPFSRHRAGRDRASTTCCPTRAGTARRAARRGSPRSSSGWAASTPACSTRPTRSTTPCSATWPRSPAPTWSTACGRPTPRPTATSRPQAMMFQAVPTALLTDAAAVDGYLRRLRGLPGFLDADHRPLPAGRGRRPAVRPGSACARPSTSSTGTWRRDLADDALLTVDAARRRATRRGPRRGGRHRRRRGPARPAAAAGLPARRAAAGGPRPTTRSASGSCPAATRATGPRCGGTPPPS